MQCLDNHQEYKGFHQPLTLTDLLDLVQGLTICQLETASFLAAAAQLAFTTPTRADAGACGGPAGVGSGGVGFHAAVGGPVLPAEVQEAMYWQHDAAAAAPSQSVRSAQPIHSCMELSQVTAECTLCCMFQGATS